jgi:hypothetical protein
MHCLRAPLATEVTEEGKGGEKQVKCQVLPNRRQERTEKSKEGRVRFSASEPSSI